MALCLSLPLCVSAAQAEGNSLPGSDDPALQPPPVAFARYVDIAATDFGYIAVTEDGQVKGFDLGRDVLFTDFAQGSLQAQLEALTDIVDVETSWKGILALRSDGSAVYLGDDAEIARQVDNWRDIVSIAVTPDGAYGLRRDGRVEQAGGWDFMGQIHVDEPRTWSNVKKLVTATCGEGQYVLALRHDGRAEFVFDNIRWTGSPDRLCDVESSGWLHMGLKEDGTVIVMGTDTDIVWEDVSRWTDIVELHAGDSSAVGLRSDGTVVWSGYADMSPLSSWRNVERLFTDDNNFIVLGLCADGSVLTWCEQKDYRSYDLSGLGLWHDIIRAEFNSRYAVALTADGWLLSGKIGEY